MKKKIPGILICLAALVLFTIIYYYKVKSYYDEVMDYSGYYVEDFTEEIKEENNRAIENETEYRKLLESSGDEADGELKDTQGLDGSSEDNAEDIKEVKDIKLHASSALLLDAGNNRVLYEKNGYDEMPMASTTKIMTCIVTLENADLEDIVTVSSYAARMPDVQLNIRTGEQYYLKDLIFSLMLGSHNDVAVAIAEHVGGSVEGFSTMMNDKARALGCYNTNFVTPNGLDAEGHYTTARDLAVIASYAIKNKKFVEITNTASHQFQELINNRKFSVTNKNKFLYMMEGAIGVKTGFTGEAGYCFVGAIASEDRTLISIVLGCGWPPNKSLKWSDTKQLMNYGIKNYEKRQIFDDAGLEPVPVRDGQIKQVSLKVDGNLSLLMREDETVHIDYDIPDALDAPINAQKVIGSAKYYINNMLYAELPIYTMDEVKRIDYRFCFDRILNLWGLLN